MKLYNSVLVATQIIAYKVGMRGVNDTSALVKLLQGECRKPTNTVLIDPLAPPPCVSIVGQLSGFGATYRGRNYPITLGLGAERRAHLKQQWPVLVMSNMTTPFALPPPNAERELGSGVPRMPARLFRNFETHERRAWT